MNKTNKTIVEDFLLSVEENENTVFDERPDDFIIKLFPFFLLVNVINTETVLTNLFALEELTSGQLIRVDGYVSLVISDDKYKEEFIRQLCIRLFEVMRFA